MAVATSITVEDWGGPRIHLRAPFEMKDACKSIAGHRWNPERKAWTYPPTPEAAAAIREIFAVRGDPAFEALLPPEPPDDSRPAEPEDEEPIPAALRPPRKYQVVGYNRVRRKPAALLEYRMGAGKTYVVINAAANLGWMRTLVSPPANVCRVWMDEALKWAPGHFHLANTYDERRAVSKRAANLRQQIELAAAREKPLLAVVNHESAWRGPMRDVLMSVRWDAAVVDESHRIGDAQTRVGSFFGRYLRQVADKRLCLSATPLRNGPLDAFGQFMFMDPGVFGGSFTRFRAEYAVMGGFGGKLVVGYRNQRDFRRRFYSVAHRVEESEIGGLPETMHTARYVELPKEARRVYDDLESKFVAAVGAGEVVAGNALSKLLRLQQITSGFAAVDDDSGAQTIQELHAAKAEALTEVLRDLPPEEPVVVFARFTRDLDAVCAAAAKAGRAGFELSGRRRQLEEWQGHGDPVLAAALRDGARHAGDVLAVQIQAGGVGVDMTRACHCVYYSLGYSLTDYTQSLGRTHRPGQSRPVTYVHLIARASVDEQVYEALENKTDVIDAILDRARRRQTPAQPTTGGEHLVEEPAAVDSAGVAEVGCDGEEPCDEQ